MPDESILMFFLHSFLFQLQYRRIWFLEQRLDVYHWIYNAKTLMFGQVIKTYESKRLQLNKPITQ